MNARQNAAFDRDSGADSLRCMLRLPMHRGPETIENGLWD